MLTALIIFDTWKHPSHPQSPPVISGGRNISWVCIQHSVLQYLRAGPTTMLAGIELDLWLISNPYQINVYVCLIYLFSAACYSSKKEDVTWHYLEKGEIGSFFFLRSAWVQMEQSVSPQPSEAVVKSPHQHQKGQHRVCCNTESSWVGWM